MDTRANRELFGEGASSEQRMAQLSANLVRSYKPANLGFYDAFVVPLGGPLAQLNSEPNAIVGTGASGYIEQELKVQLRERQLTKESPFRIGVAAGRATYHLAQALTPGCFSGQHIEVYALTVGPIPESVYSAGTVAQMIADRWGLSFPEEKLATLFFIPGATTPITGTDIVGVLQLLKNPNLGSIAKPWQMDYAESFTEFFDWLIVGIGAYYSGSFLGTQLEALFPGVQFRDKVIGDICSRFFDDNGMEWPDGKDVSDQISWTSLDTLYSLAQDRDKRVIAIAGGRYKVQAITIVMNKGWIDTLITDDVVARALI